MPDSIPQTVGKYPIQSVLGKGAMGIVFLGRHEQLRRPVAIKMMLPKAARNPSAHARFLREARALAAIRSPHVVAVYDVDEFEGKPYFVMEYVEGTPLDRFLAESPPRDLTTILDLCTDFAQGLADAHSTGVIHRDLKPANLFVEKLKGRGKLLDFGLTHISETTKLTNAGTVMGTPSYMPLEQAEGKPADQRSDIYSLGVVFYEIASGQLPVQGETMAQIIYSLMKREPVRVETLNRSLPTAFADLVHRMLRRDPGQRPQSVDEVVEVLKSLRGARSVSRVELSSIPTSPTVTNPPVTEIILNRRSDNVPKPKPDWILDTESRNKSRVSDKTGEEETETTPSGDGSALKWIWGGVFMALSLAVLLVMAFRSSGDPEKEKELAASKQREIEQREEIERLQKIEDERKQRYADAAKLKREEEDRKKKEAESKPNKPMKTAPEKKEPTPEVKKHEPPKQVAKLDPEPQPAEPKQPEPRKAPAPLDCTKGLDAATVKAAQKDWAAYLGVEVDVVVELGGGVKMEFVLIPPGKFTMGSNDGNPDERPPHPVTLTKPFYLAKHETTQEQYAQLLGAGNPSHFKKETTWKRHPVEQVSWDDATKAWEKLATKPLPKRFKRPSLPTEAQWEYACRAGTTTRYHFGEKNNGTEANCDGRLPDGAAAGPSLLRTTPVGQYRPNAFGLFDMHGNVFEWCLDGYEYTAYKAEGRTDPEVKEGFEKSRCLRGGSWISSSTVCRSALRYKYVPVDSLNDCGFRLALLPRD